MNNFIYGVYGTGGCGRGVMPLARQQLESNGISPNYLYFIDDDSRQTEVNGQKVLSYQDFLYLEAARKFVAIAIASSSSRERVAAQCGRDGMVPWLIKADGVIVMDEVEIGAGAILCPFVTLTSNIRIGKYFHANLYSYVEHDCVIGDYVTFAPSVKCNGNIKIGNHVYIGTGAVMKQGRPEKPLVIGDGAIIGMGAVVTKDVPAGVVVAGNPARVMEMKSI